MFRLAVSLRAGWPCQEQEGIGRRAEVGLALPRRAAWAATMGWVSRLVLVVDDDVDFRSLLTRIVTGWGHDVIEAGSVSEALARATEQRPGTALVDIGLPDGNGFDLTRQLVGMSWPIRVVLISTDTGTGNGHAARRAGAIGFLPKDELLSKEIRRLIEGP